MTPIRAVWQIASKDYACDACAAWHRSGVRVARGSGDNPTTAEASVELLGIDEGRAGRTPDGEGAAVRALRLKRGSALRVSEGSRAARRRAFDTPASSHPTFTDP